MDAAAVAEAVVVTAAATAVTVNAEMAAAVAAATNARKFLVFTKVSCCARLKLLCNSVSIVGCH